MSALAPCGHASDVSATSGYKPDAAPSHTVARQRKLRTTLLSYGVLTRGSLRELTGADHWEVVFDLVLLRAIAAGRVRRLSRRSVRGRADALSDPRAHAGAS